MTLIKLILILPIFFLSFCASSILKNRTIEPCETLLQIDGDINDWTNEKYGFYFDNCEIKTCFEGINMDALPVKLSSIKTNSNVPECWQKGWFRANPLLPEKAILTGVRVYKYKSRLPNCSINKLLTSPRGRINLNIKFNEANKIEQYINKPNRRFLRYTFNPVWCNYKNIPDSLAFYQEDCTKVEKSSVKREDIIICPNLFQSIIDKEVFLKKESIYISGLIKITNMSNIPLLIDTIMFSNKNTSFLGLPDWMQIKDKPNQKIPIPAQTSIAVEYKSDITHLLEGKTAKEFLKKDYILKGKVKFQHYPKLNQSFTIVLNDKEMFVPEIIE